MADYTVLGAGRLGGTLARRLAGLNHDVQVIVPDPSDDKYRALGRIPGLSLDRAGTKSTGDMIFVATPWEVTETALGTLQGLDGKPLVDCTNPVRYGAEGLSLAIDANRSAAEMIQAWVPAARVVKTLNQVGSDVLSDPSALTPAPVMGIASDDDAAKAQVLALLVDLGFDVLDAGGLGHARLLEAFALLWMGQAFASGDPGGFAFGRSARP